MENMMTALTNLAKYLSCICPYRMGFLLKGSGRGSNKWNMSYS